MSTYVLDANVFIEAYRRYYAFDIAPTFWNKLIGLASSGKVVSIDRVKDELTRSNDDLSKWAEGDFHRWFVSTGTERVINCYREIIKWAVSQNQFTEVAKREFAKAENADAWLVAFAYVNGCIVVTHERFDKNINRRIPIPNVCTAFNIPYKDLFDMLRALNVRL